MSKQSGKIVLFRVSSETKAALDKLVKDLGFGATAADVGRTALEDYLRDKGYLPERLVHVGRESAKPVKSLAASEVFADISPEELAKMLALLNQKIDKLTQQVESEAFEKGERKISRSRKAKK